MCYFSVPFIFWAVYIYTHTQSTSQKFGHTYSFKGVYFFCTMSYIKESVKQIKIYFIFEILQILLIIYDKNNLRIDFKHRLTCFYYLLLYFFDFSSWFWECALCLWISEQNAPTKRRYLDIKINFIEQNKHLLCNMESCECKNPSLTGLLPSSALIEINKGS